MSKLVVVDFSNIVQACWRQHLTMNGIKPEEATAEHDPGWLPNLALKLNALEKMHRVPVNQFFFAQDTHRPLAKYEIFPEYKGQRTETYNPRPAAVSWLKERYGSLHLFHAIDHEADDAIAALIAQTPPMNQNRFIVVTGDRDLWQLLGDPRVQVWDHVQKIFVLPERIKKKFGVSRPDLIPIVKALWGDPSDNIPNCVPRQQRQLIPYIEQTDGTLNHLLQLIALAPISDRCRQLMRDNWKQITINDRLVRLNPRAQLRVG